MAVMTNEFALDVHSDRQLRTRGLDAVLAYLAERQHGVVARWQLLRLGFGEGAIDMRVKRGRLHVVYRGVYAVGHSVISVRGRWMAAVLVGGHDAVLSHRDAGGAWNILAAGATRIEITTPRRLHSRPGIRAHMGKLPKDEVAVLDGIPITTVPRTIFDLAGREPQRRIETAIHEAEVQRLHDPLSLPDLIRRYPRARGVRMIRAILADRERGTTATKQEFVDLFIEFLDSHGLPRPETDQWIRIGRRWIEADCVWREEKVIVELDGYAVHGTRRNFESDRARDRAIHITDWRVIRITWRQLHDERAELAADLSVLLAPTRRAA
ncbi:MAG: hypothetical protein QOG86_1280 [Thermoleophilaceae bacterium]|nr:hypothetical protein [Thermoleophilaceae bacterium]